MFKSAKIDHFCGFSEKCQKSPKIDVLMVRFDDFDRFDDSNDVTKVQSCVNEGYDDLYDLKVDV